MRHDRRCETCGLLFDCRNERQWICFACQEKRKQLKLPAPSAGIAGIELTIQPRMRVGRQRNAIRKWARQK